MKKVFAVLFFLIFLWGCRVSSNQDAQEINSTLKNNIIYSAPGDFDGDDRSENIYITEYDSKYYLSLVKSKKTYSNELDFKVDSFNSIIQDINNDGREEFILNVIQDNCENCYVFSLNDRLLTVLSPDLITKHMGFKELEAAFTYNNKSTALDKNIHLSDSCVKLYYTEMDYTGEEPVFISEGVVYDKNQSMYNIRISSRVNKNNQVILSKVEVNP